MISAFHYAAGRVVQSDMPARLADRRVLDDEQIAAVVDAVLAVERYYGYPVDVEWVLDKYRRAGEPVCIVQARPATLTSAGTDPMPTTCDPAAIATKYALTLIPGGTTIIRRDGSRLSEFCRPVLHLDGRRTRRNRSSLHLRAAGTMERNITQALVLGRPATRRRGVSERGPKSLTPSKGAGG